MIWARTVSGRTAATILVVLVLFSVAFVGNVAAHMTTAPNCGTVGYNGDGTTTNPHEVTNISQLQCIEEQDLTANYTLVSNIDASGTSSWNGGDGFEPIGDSRDPESFTGTFDGNGNAIQNLTIDRVGEDRVGLFDRIWDGGTVENVVLNEVTVRGDYRVGGIAGLVEGGTVERSSVNGTVTGSTSVGGIVGTLFNIEGSITQDPVRSRLNDSFVSGNVTGATGRAGGIVGLNRGTVRETYSMASVESDSFVGGIVAINGNEGIIRESYAAGFVTGNDYVGGIGGQSGGEITETYWDTETTSQHTGIGLGSGGTNVKGLTTEEMKGDASKTNMVGFDFANTWSVLGTNNAISYPFLRSNKQVPEPGLELLRSNYSVTVTEVNNSVVAGDNVVAKATITNIGSRDGNQTVEFTLNGSVKDYRTVFLNVNESTTETFVYKSESSDIPMIEVAFTTANDTDSRSINVGRKDCLERRSVGRDEQGNECPKDSRISRGGSREELDRETGRRSGTRRRDRGRASLGQ